jgi:hypothetical protein
LQIALLVFHFNFVVVNLQYKWSTSTSTANWNRHIAWITKSNDYKIVGKVWYAACVGKFLTLQGFRSAHQVASEGFRLLFRGNVWAQWAADVQR